MLWEYYNLIITIININAWYCVILFTCCVFTVHFRSSITHVAPAFYWPSQSICSSFYIFNVNVKRRSGALNIFRMDKAVHSSKEPVMEKCLLFYPRTLQHCASLKIQVMGHHCTKTGGSKMESIFRWALFKHMNALLRIIYLVLTDRVFHTNLFPPW